MYTARVCVRVIQSVIWRQLPCISQPDTLECSAQVLSFSQLRACFLFLMLLFFSFSQHPHYLLSLRLPRARAYSRLFPPCRISCSLPAARAQKSSCAAPAPLGSRRASKREEKSSRRAATATVHFCDFYEIETSRAAVDSIVPYAPCYTMFPRF